MSLFQIGHTYILLDNGMWKDLSTLSTVTPYKTRQNNVISLEPNLKVRTLNGIACSNCALFFPINEVNEKLCDGYCQQCAFPTLWNLKKTKFIKDYK